MDSVWLTQGIGVIALVLYLVAHQSKTRSQILRYQSIGALLYAIHFALLSAWTGALSNLLVAARNWVFDQKTRHRWAQHIAWLFIFIIAMLIMLYVSWAGWISLLPALAVIIGTYGRWLDSASVIRFAALMGVILWIPYTVFVHSYAGFITQLLLGATIIYGMVKHDGLFRKTLVT